MAFVSPGSEVCLESSHIFSWTMCTGEFRVSASVLLFLPFRNDTVLPVISVSYTRSTSHEQLQRRAAAKGGDGVPKGVQCATVRRI